MPVLCVVIDLCFLVLGELTGERKCSYEALRTGKVLLQGLPIGLKFTDPWSAGKKKLQEVLSLKDNISFQR